MFYDAISQFSNNLNFTNISSNIVRKNKRRTCIPPRSVPSSSLMSLLKFLKSAAGKDLNTISLPATLFSEPVSILQRCTEFLEYSGLLDQAAECGMNSQKQMCYVTAFEISSYSTFFDRLAKPFNSMINETFELDKTNDEGYGWRCFSEKVSHFPNRLAMVT